MKRGTPRCVEIKGKGIPGLPFSTLNTLGSAWGALQFAERVSGLHPLLSHCSSSEGQVVRNLKVEEGRKALNNLGMKRFTILLIF